MNKQWSIERVEGAHRQQVFQFIAAQFEQHFGACITDDSDELYGIYSEERQLDAAFGLNRQPDQFFINHYVDNLSDRLTEKYPNSGQPQPLAEFVHFSVRTPRLVCQLLPVLREFLSQETSLLVCTATRELATFFSRKGIAPHVLGHASLQKLPTDLQHGWGTYYEHAPTVLLGQPQDTRRSEAFV